MRKTLAALAVLLVPGAALAQLAPSNVTQPRQQAPQQQAPAALPGTAGRVTAPVIPRDPAAANLSRPVLAAWLARQFDTEVFDTKGFRVTVRFSPALQRGELLLVGESLPGDGSRLVETVESVARKLARQAPSAEDGDAGTRLPRRAHRRARAPARQERGPRRVGQPRAHARSAALRMMVKRAPEGGVSLGQYNRSMRMNLSFGAGSQFDIGPRRAHNSRQRYRKRTIGQQ